MKRLLPLLGVAIALALVSIPVRTQTPATPLSLPFVFPGTPTGACTNGTFAINAGGGNFYVCINGVWASPTGLTIGSGTATMTTAAITAPACGTTVTVAATGVVATDSIYTSFNAAPAGTNAGLVSWPTAGNVNFAYCPGVTETPAAATVNWRVVR